MVPRSQSSWVLIDIVNPLLVVNLLQTAIDVFMISVRVSLHRNVPLRVLLLAPFLRDLAVLIPEKSLFALISRKSELLADAFIPSMLLLEASLVATSSGPKSVAHTVAFVVTISAF